MYSTTGDFPTVMKEWIAKKCEEEGYSRSRLPSFTNEESGMVKGEFHLRANSEGAKKGNFCEKVNLILNTEWLKNSKRKARNEKSTLKRVPLNIQI
jgi:hypothetical protein